MEMGIVFRGKPFTYDFHSLINDYEYVTLYVVIAVTPALTSFIFYRRTYYKSSLVFSVGYLLTIILRPWRYKVSVIFAIERLFHSYVG